MTIFFTSWTLALHAARCELLSGSLRTQSLLPRFRQLQQLNGDGGRAETPNASYGFGENDVTSAALQSDERLI